MVKRSLIISLATLLVVISLLPQTVSSYVPSSPLSPVAYQKTYIPTVIVPLTILKVIVWRDSDKSQSFEKDEVVDRQRVYASTDSAAIVEVTGDDGSVTFMFQSGIWEISACNFNFKIDTNVVSAIPGQVMIECSSR